MGNVAVIVCFGYVLSLAVFGWWVLRPTPVPPLSPQLQAKRDTILAYGAQLSARWVDGRVPVRFGAPIGSAQLSQLRGTILGQYTQDRRYTFARDAGFITLNKDSLENLTTNEWREVVQHEIAHALVNKRVGFTGISHGVEWQQAAADVGAIPHEYSNYNLRKQTDE